MKKTLIFLSLLFCSTFASAQNIGHFLVQNEGVSTYIPLWGIIFTGLVLFLTVVLIKISARRESYGFALNPIFFIICLLFIFLSLGGATNTINSPSYLYVMGFIFSLFAFNFSISFSLSNNPDSKLNRKSNIFIVLNITCLLLFWFFRTEFMSLYLSSIVGTVFGSFFLLIIFYKKRKRREQYLKHK